MVICSQLPLSNWYQALEEGTVADAILDRVIHNGVRVELSGESMRKIESMGLQESLDPI